LRYLHRRFFAKNGDTTSQGAKLQKKVSRRQYFFEQHLSERRCPTGLTGLTGLTSPANLPRQSLMGLCRAERQKYKNSSNKIAREVKNG
jgi:hypothetical protein